jgi:uncharacterized protein (TIGR02268 family)
VLASRVVVWPILAVVLCAAAPAPRVPRERKLVVRAEEATTLQLLRVAPGVVTTVVFNDDILPESVDAKALAPLFAQVKVYPGVMVLRPSVAMPDAARPLLTARFAGGNAPRQVSFLLVTDPKEVDSVVEVSRHAMSPEDLSEELALLRGRCAAAEAGLATLRAQCAQTGLGGAVLTGALGANPVSVERLDPPVQDPGLTVQSASMLYRHMSTRVLAFTLVNALASSPWTPGVGRLSWVARDGRTARVVQEFPVRMLESRLAPGGHGFAVLEWQTPLGLESGGKYVLEAWNQERDRSVRWEGLSP